MDALPILSVTGPTTLEFVTPVKFGEPSANVGLPQEVYLIRNLCRRALDFIFNERIECDGRSYECRSRTWVRRQSVAPTAATVARPSCVLCSVVAAQSAVHK